MKRLRLFGSIRSDAGSALVELSFALPILIAILIFTVDYSRVFYTAMALTDAARAGAQYGAFNLGNSGDTTGMQNAATNATSVSGISASASRLCQCATDAGVFSATLPLANDCTTLETVACPLKHRVITVTVTTTKTFTTVFGLFPGVPNSTTLTRTATLRVPQ